MNKFYLTTSIPYVNAAPHIGFALEAVQADVIARYKRLIGEDIYFSSGSDENSLKNVRAAEKEKISTKELVNKYAEEFAKLKNKNALNLTYDVFNRTSDAHHFKGAQKLWESCKKEDIYKKSYTGLYCVGCEEFYTVDELIDGKCPEHKVELEKVEEENYFFKLSNYQDQLEDLIKKDTVKIIPDFRKNEILAFIRSGLRDFSISRSQERAKDWGVPVPGDKSQIMYVWFDALTTYLTAIGYGSDERLFKNYWSQDSEKIHLIGKGIIRFHAVYWIAMLLSANLPLPNIELVHGYVTVDGQKISKSLGNVISPFDIATKYGTDVLRYYLLREIPSTDDGDFSERRLKEIYNSDLANGLGNLVARVAKLAENNNVEIHETVNELEPHLSTLLNAFNFTEALGFVWGIISIVDHEINKSKPWDLKGSEAKKAISEFSHTILVIAANLKPFLPETSEKISKQFSGKVKASEPLFPRLT